MKSRWGSDDERAVAVAVGRGGVPALFGPADWAATNPAGRLRAGDVLVVTVDYDGAGGMAAQDVTVELVVLEG